MTKMSFSGGCLCGAVRYTVTAEPSWIYYCHCADCRKSNGTAFHVGMVVPADSVAWTGSLKEYAKPADSGRTIRRFFCGDCGSQLYTPTSFDPELISLKAGTMDDPSGLRPTAEIWTQSKMAWADLPDDIDSYPRGRSG
ncbi:MAG: GFA family protein [Pseudomonadota bacterium]